jgi:hypothetical protein
MLAGLAVGDRVECGGQGVDLSLAVGQVLGNEAMFEGAGVMDHRGWLFSCYGRK